MQPRAVNAVISGQVQGVGFRFGCKDRARELGLRGWIRNELDGTVALHVEGPDEAVQSLLDWCRQGPPGAQVSDVRVTDTRIENADDFIVSG